MVKELRTFLFEKLSINLTDSTKSLATKKVLHALWYKILDDKRSSKKESCEDMHTHGRTQN